MRILRRVGCVALAAFALLVAGLVGSVAVAFAAGGEPLRGQWHLDESCGGPCSTFADSSGNGLAGTATGGPVYVADGRFAGAQAFPSKSESINVGNQPLLQPSTVTLLAWVRASSTPSQVKAIAAQGADGSCGHASYALYTGGSLDASGLRFYIWNGTSGPVSPAADNAMWDGKWHLAAGTYDGATVRLYVDGNEVGSGTPSSGSIAYGLAGNNNFTIGNYGGAAECTENTNFSGNVDEVRVYSRALSATEIGRLAAATGPQPPDLVPDSQPAPQPPTARFTATPNPTCVDSNTVLDGSASTPGDGGPIIQYAYFEGPVTPTSTPLATAAVTTVVFPWSAEDFGASQTIRSPFSGGLVLISPWIRTPAVVTLRVTDATGHQASATHTIDFLQKSTIDSRSGCPPVSQAQQSNTPKTGLPTPKISTVDTSSFFNSAYDARLACNSNSTCSGDAAAVSLKISDLEKQLNQAEQNQSTSQAAAEQARDRRRAAQDAIQKVLDILRSLNPCLRITIPRTKPTAHPASACKPLGESIARLGPNLDKRKRVRPEIIGHSTYALEPHQRMRIRIRLTRSATRFLRKWKWLNVGIAITEPGPTGKLRVRTKIVTLKARTHKQR